MHVLTFVTLNRADDFDLPISRSYPEIKITERKILQGGIASDWFVQTPIDKIVLDDICGRFRVDIIQQEVSARSKKLFLADMDSTIVAGETLDDMAAFAGIGDKIAAITARAMCGEIDFETALYERVGMLKGLRSDIIDQTLAETRLNDGAQELLAALRRKGVYCVLVSGGFTRFTSAIAAQLGFDAHFGNDLIIENGLLTGEVGRPVLDKDFKRRKMDELCADMNITPHEVVAVGDGANDLPMLTGAGLGVGYYPKPLLRETLVNRIEYTNLSSLIYALAL